MRHLLPRFRRQHRSLIPLWLEAGINFFWPLECAAGMDPLALRKQYGKEIVLSGGLDKRELMRDKAA